MQMPDSKAFIDTNILLYLLSSDIEKANHAETILQRGGLISVQVLNEFTNVVRRQQLLSWTEITEVLDLITSIFPVVPLTLETHNKGRFIAERYKLSVYDAMIVASALSGECEILYSEDMQDNLIIEDQLRIGNPFTG
jgi:predicted nucleic acid-binding protein